MNPDWFLGLADYGSLQDTVNRLRYKPGWSFSLRNGYTSSSTATEYLGPHTASAGAASILTGPVFLDVTIVTWDSGSPDSRIKVTHSFMFPEPVSSSRELIERWLLDRIIDVEHHEACEFFRIGDSKPYFPDHGPDASLYTIRRVS